MEMKIVCIVISFCFGNLILIDDFNRPILTVNRVRM